MKTIAGLWIDHRKAVISIFSTEGEETIEIKSNVEEQSGRFKGIRSTTPYVTSHINLYYARIIDAVRDAESILIFGPGEAKDELKKRLDHAKVKGHLLERETSYKMTDCQIMAKVCDYAHQ